MSRIIAMPSRKVKPGRRTARPAGRFGEGLGRAFVPFYGTMPWTKADLDWAAQHLNDDDSGLTDAEMDRLADESAAFDAIAAGCFA